jgi:hypothetical protein
MWEKQNFFSVSLQKYVPHCTKAVGKILRHENFPGQHKENARLPERNFYS